MNEEALDVVVEYKISQHAKQRYAERIMGKDNEVDVNRFVTLNEDKIKKDINKLIQYGEFIYSGKQSHKDGKGNTIDVYLKDAWVILVDKNTNVVVTLYKIDLGLDDEFNKTYIFKMMEKLNASKEVLKKIQEEVQNDSSTYRQLIEDAEIQIKEYKSMISNLEELCSGYKTIVNNNIVKVSQANRDVADIVNKLVNKKEF